MLEKLPELARGQSGVEPYGGFISYNPPPDGLRRTLNLAFTADEITVSIRTGDTRIAGAFTEDAKFTFDRQWRCTSESQAEAERFDRENPLVENALQWLRKAIEEERKPKMPWRLSPDGMECEQRQDGDLPNRPNGLWVQRRGEHVWRRYQIPENAGPPRWAALSDGHLALLDPSPGDHPMQCTWQERPNGNWVLPHIRRPSIIMLREYQPEDLIPYPSPNDVPKKPGWQEEAERIRRLKEELRAIRLGWQAGRRPAP